MGNSQTKESRSLNSVPGQGSQQWSPSSHGDAGQSPYGDRSDGSRPARRSRPDLSILGIGTSSRDTVAVESRRETKQERDARRLEKERAARIRERERSMREEHVDGGYLVTQGVYVGTEDFNKAIARQLMIERRLAPFWRGLNDFSDSWTEHQLMAAARGLPIPKPDEIPPELEYKNPPKPTSEQEPASTSDIQLLTIPITSRSQSHNSDASQPSGVINSVVSPAASGAPGGPGSPLFRTRAKTLAVLTNSSKSNAQPELASREVQLPVDPFVNGQPIEAYLYKDAMECPICFLYYPPYLNRTRCCNQPICSECFVQIKRPDPHVPEHAVNHAEAHAEARAEIHGETQTEIHAESDQNPPPSVSEGSEESQLVSEPAACPFCVQLELGVTYSPPPFRRGLAYASELSSRPNASPAMSSASSLSLGNISTPATTGRGRATSLSASDPAVVTTDKIRPDWAQKLASARAHAARRSAAATALHTAAYLMNSAQSTSDSRAFSLTRRGVMRRAGATGSQTPPHRGSPALSALAFLTDRRVPGQEGDSAEEGSNSASAPRGNSRRTRIDDLEDMMVMEAIRLSLASEEDRIRREEKEVRKEIKKREKEAKKADKAARRNGLHSNNASSLGIDGSTDGRSGKIASSSSSAVAETSTAGKGKGVERVLPRSAAGSIERSRDTSSDQVNPEPTTMSQIDQTPTSMLGSAQPLITESSKKSYLRHMSSVASPHPPHAEDCDERPVRDERVQAPTEQMFSREVLTATTGNEGGGSEAHAEHISKPIVNEGASSDMNLQPSQACSTAAGLKSMEDPKANESAQENHTSKELETRSIEITSPASRPETLS